jgi:hypothetical protein
VAVNGTAVEVAVVGTDVGGATKVNVGGGLVGTQVGVGGNDVAEGGTKVIVAGGSVGTQIGVGDGKIGVGGNDVAEGGTKVNVAGGLVGTQVGVGDGKSVEVGVKLATTLAVGVAVVGVLPSQSQRPYPHAGDVDNCLNVLGSVQTGVTANKGVPDLSFGPNAPVNDAGFVLTQKLLSIVMPVLPSNQGWVLGKILRVITTLVLLPLAKYMADVFMSWNVLYSIKAVFMPP